ncbi:DUF397 domain-containing protein [Streptomyces sp. NRRL S-15]|uniref:DUF397 domain-containing protein n=1 Tax=Streptomyces sp. NRRL S-15 TaxID=1463886 RepID=UPI00099C46CD|nr:DUF397 domain-containing protein [Streptomyces sp. NRRL S-15]
MHGSSNGWWERHEPGKRGHGRAALCLLYTSRQVYVRDSKATSGGPTLRVGRGQWTAFLALARG